MISLDCRKTCFSLNTLGFSFFRMSNVLKSATTAEGGGGAIKFSAEKMVNSATRRIVECIRFLHEKKPN